MGLKTNLAVGGLSGVDMSWTFPLGLQEGGEPPRVWPPEDEADQRTEPNRTGDLPTESKRTDDQPDPRPPTQESGDGAL